VKEEFENIDNLIGNLLAGEATPEEKTKVAEWVSQSADNKAYFEQLKAIFEAASSKNILLQVDADAAWQKVKSKLKQPNKKVETNYWTILKIAAGLAWLGFLAFMFFQNRNSEEKDQTISFKTEKQTQQDTLLDGSTAFLNRNSNLVYSYKPKEKSRTVKLSGEAFFEVKHDDQKPFIIETEEVFIKDIGTEFNVKAYPEDSIVMVTVSSGEVKFYSTNNPGLHLKAGEKGIYDKSMKAFFKILKKDTNVLAYKNKILTFKNLDLQSVINSLNEVYDTKITLANEAIKKCRLTVNFNNDRLETIIDVIAETLHLSVTKTEEEVILSGTGCNN
jgi:ferric-dicitrate binding protein FerR (iron transport regulator)